jgi:hypothetical protein
VKIVIHPMYGTHKCSICGNEDTHKVLYINLDLEAEYSMHKLGYPKYKLEITVCEGCFKE